MFTIILYFLLLKKHIKVSVASTPVNTEVLDAQIMY